jgi:hypothetical protein
MDTLTANNTTTAPATQAAAPRVDLYAGIHRALRHFMNDTLGRLGGSTSPTRPRFALRWRNSRR